MGPRGLNWLKVHVANLYGKDKISFEERVQFVDSELDNIFDAATNPLGGRRWWLNADYPWQVCYFYYFILFIFIYFFLFILLFLFLFSFSLFYLSVINILIYPLSLY